MKKGGFQRHLSGKAELIPLFPVFLDYAFADLTKAIDCVALKCSFKGPLYVREWRKGLIKQSRTWKVIQMQLVVNFNLCVFIMLRKPASLGHFVLWWLTPHAIIPNPKGYGPLAWISIVGLLPSLLETLLLEVSLWWRRWIKRQAKTREWDGGQKLDFPLSWKQVFCDFLERVATISSPGFWPLWEASPSVGPSPPGNPLQGSAPIGWTWRTPPPTADFAVQGVVASSWLACHCEVSPFLVWIFSFSIIYVTRLCTNFLLFERYRMTYVFFTAISLVCSAQTIL